MKVIILDYSDGKVKIVNNISENLQVEEVEELLYEKYNIKHSSIEFMIVSELEIENIN